MVLAQRKVLIMAADHFEDMELLYPLYRLAEEDVEVTVAGLDDDPVRGKKGHGPVPVEPPWTRWPRVTSTPWSSRAATRRTSCALGHRAHPCGRSTGRTSRSPSSATRLGADPGQDPQGPAGHQRGAIRDDMVNAGADWVDEATVVDGNLISARTPADLGPWMKALLKALAAG